MLTAVRRCAHIRPVALQNVATVAVSPKRGKRVTASRVRRTTVATSRGGLVEAVALWVHLDPVSLRPIPFGAQELEVYGPSAAGREVKARLRHPAPPDGAPSRPWSFRATELDVADHINNAAYWSPLEAELLAGATEPEAIDVELEHKTPAQPGAHAIVADGSYRWVVAEGGEVRASFLVG